MLANICAEIEYSLEIHRPTNGAHVDFDHVNSIHQSLFIIITSKIERSL